MSDCTRCTRPAGAGFLCPTCTDKVADLLAMVPDLLRDLDITHARGDRLTAGSDRASADRPLPYKSPASDSILALTSVVTYWSCRVNVRAEILPERCSDLAPWLRNRLDWLVLLPDAGQAYSDVRGTVERAVVVIDLPITRTKFPVGPCPEGGCAGTVWAFLPPVGTGTAVLRCLGCGGEWGTTQWVRVGRQILRKLGQEVAA